jgi:homoserine kinase type II
MGTFRSLSDADVTAVLSRFGVTGCRSATPIAAGTINTNFALQLDGVGQGGHEAARRFLRINEGKAREDVVREAAIVEHVAARGVRTPRPIHARDGAPYAEWQGVYVSLFPWVEGTTLGRSQVGPGQAGQAGRALAELHRAGADYPDHRPGRYELDEIERRLAAISAGGDPLVEAAVAELRPALARVHGERAPALPLGLIHGDLFIDNVLYDQGSLAALLDFEQASWGRLVYDLAVSVLAFGFGTDDDFRPDVTRAFIDGYCALRPVAAEEAQGFAAELRLAACRFAVTRITDVYQRRTAGAPAGKDFRRYLARLRAVDRAMAAGGQLFQLR